MHLALTPSVANWPTSALVVFLAVLTTRLCRNSYAFQPLIRHHSLRPAPVCGSLFAAKVQLKTDIIDSPQALLNNEVWDAHYLELVDFLKTHGHVYVPIEASVAQEEYRALAYFCHTWRFHYQYQYRKSAETYVKTSLLNNHPRLLLDSLGFDWSANNALWKCDFDKQNHLHESMDTVIGIKIYCFEIG
jgi:hypothetical protein